MNKLLMFLTLILFTISATAQNAKLAGSWLLTKAQVQGKTKRPYQLFEFRKDGKLVAMEIKVGTWQYNAKSKTLTLQSKMDKDFNGKGKIVTLTDAQMVLIKDGMTFSYSRVLPAEVAKANKASGLAGDWKLDDPEYSSTFLKLELPDAFLLVRSQAGETDKARGTWMFDAKDRAIIFIGFSHLLRGKISLSDAGAEGFTLKLPENTLRAHPVKAEDNKIERLTYSEDDFPEDAEPDASRLPWPDFEDMARALQNVALLQYDFGTLVPELKVLKHTYFILSKVQVDPQKPSVRFTNFTVTGKDTSQFSENYKGGLMNSYNAFFPREEPWPYRIKGVENVTIPAGTFECTVVEAMDGDKKLKYWLVNKLPGVYAKIIQEKVDPFGDLSYTVQELSSIQYRDKK